MGLASCAEAELNAPGLDPNAVDGNTVIATIETISDSRASINDIGKICWSKGDQIAVLKTNNEYVDLKLDDAHHGEQTGAFSGTFIGELHENPHAFYPHNIAKAVDVVTLPTSYDIENDFNNSHVAMKATKTSGAMVFKHLGGVMYLNLKTVPAGACKLVFTAHDKNITGDFNLTNVDGNETILVTDGINSTITVNFTALTEKSNIGIYVPLPVGSYSGFSIEIKNSSDKDVAPAGVFTDTNFSIKRAVRLNATISCVEIVAGTEEPEPTGTKIQDGVYQTADKEYTLTNANGLVWVADQVKNESNDFAGVTITLPENGTIDMTGESWTPISNTSRKDDNSGFKGVFDGNGCTITGLTVETTDDDYGAGLFGVVNGGTVKNVNIEGANISSTIDCAGAICGVMLGKSHIEGCTVSNSTISAASAAGGVVGRAYGSNNVITGCTNNATVTGDKKVGGIVGITNNPTTITDCTNNGAVSGGKDGVAGIAGYVNTSTTITGCSNTGAIGKPSDKYAGGIVGYQQGATITVSNCTNSAEIKAINAGGIYGIPGQYQGGSIKGCNNTGKITGVNIAGGIMASQGNMNVENCTNTAEVLTTGSGATTMAGGVIGFSHGSGEREIKNCSGGTAAITAKYAGRLIGGYSHYSKPLTDSLLYINDDNGDNYTSLPTVAIFSPGTTLSYLKVMGGTLHGTPAIGGNNGYIIITEGASWDKFPGETGTWMRSKSASEWTKQQ